MFPIRTTAAWTGSRSAWRWWRRRATVCSPRYGQQWRSRRHERRHGEQVGQPALRVTARGRCGRGCPSRSQYEPTLPGPVFAAHFHLSGEPTGPVHLRPGRRTPPGPSGAGHRRAGGTGRGRVETLVFASGMAAVSAVLFSQLRAGDAVVLPGRRLSGAAAGARPAGGVRHRGAHRADRRRRPARPSSTARGCCGSRRPSNPGLDVCDVRRLAEAAHARGRAGRRRQHPCDAARPAPAGAGRRLLGGQRHQAAHRATATSCSAMSPAATPQLAAARTALAQDRRGDSRARWRPGSRTARWPRSSCASTGSAPTRWRSPRRCASAPR